MALSYGKLRKRPVVFQRVTGMRVEEFQAVCERIYPVWESKQAKKHPQGRPSRFRSLEDRALALFIYYRTYITHEMLGYVFGLHNANISRQFKRLEPLVAQVIHIKKDRTLTSEKVLELIADATEQRIQRPKKRSVQRRHYSGKKKCHTRKVELVMEPTGRILSVSRSVPGSQHDFRLRQSESPLPIHSKKWVDSGYQGLQKHATDVHLPIKRQRGKKLTPEQKHHNQQHARLRVKVEHKFRELKIFKILADPYRNFGKKHHLRFNILAGFLNLRHGF